MSDDLQASLHTYKLQLTQVEAALTTDSENSELHKLKEDLLAVINLTNELLTSQAEASGREAEQKQTDMGQFPQKVTPLISQWNVGDKCQGIWSGDGQYYNATITNISGDGQCTVLFDGYRKKTVTPIVLLRPRGSGAKRKISDGEKETGKRILKKVYIKQQREHLKKKLLKKQQRLKQQEEEREQEKNKWQSFAQKALGKNKKGFNKKSIFASPDNIVGRVGVGTCGIAGRPMTAFAIADKWRKGV